MSNLTSCVHGYVTVKLCSSNLIRMAWCVRLQGLCSVTGVIQSDRGPPSHFTYPTFVNLGTASYSLHTHTHTQTRFQADKSSKCHQNLQRDSKRSNGSARKQTRLKLSSQLVPIPQARRSRLRHTIPTCLQHHHRWLVETDRQAPTRPKTCTAVPKLRSNPLQGVDPLERVNESWLHDLAEYLNGES